MAVPADLAVPIDAAPASDFACGGEPLKLPDGGLLCRDEGFRWVFPQPQGVAFDSVYSFGPNDAWAVGDGGAMHWDGNRWTLVKSPVAIRGGGVWGRAPNDVWIAARRTGDGMLLHWTGGAFDVVSTGINGAIGHGAGSQGIGGTDSAGWAVGDQTSAPYENFALRWQCGAWRRMPPPPDLKANDLLVFGADDVWLTSQTEAGHTGPRLPWHWDGGSWRPVAVERSVSSEFVYLRGLGGSKSSDIWAIGEEYESFPNDWTGSRVYRGDVNGLRLMHSFEPGLFAIWVESPTSVWLAGKDGRIEHWDGQTWTRQQTNTQASFYAIDRYWAVGETIAQRQGDHWQPLLPALPQKDFGWVGGYAATVTDAWLVSTDSGAWHWDGRVWNQEPGLAKERLRVAWGRGSNDVWLAGEKVFRWDGKRMTSIVDPLLDSEVVGMWGTIGGPDVWFLLERSRDHVVRWDGARFLRESVPVDRFGVNFVAISGVDVNDIWAAARSGEVFHRAGGKWQAAYTRPKSYLVDVLALAADDVWITDSGQPLLHWDGKVWKQTGPSVFRLWGKSPRSVWAIATGGFTESVPLWHGDGGRWDCVTAFPNLSVVFGSSDGDVWLVGGNSGRPSIFHKGP